MGCSWSSKSSTTPTRRSSGSNSKSNMIYDNIIRVVHLNGELDVYSDPLTVSQVTEKKPKHFVFPQTQLLSLDSKPLDTNTQLQLGNIYFLLPHSVFQSEVSPIDLATIYRRLTLAAKSKNCSSTSSLSSPATKTLLVHSASTKTRTSEKKNNDTLSRAKSSPNRYADRWSSTSPNRYADRWSSTSPNRYDGLDTFLNVQKQASPACDQSPCWKPILESIVEKSFTRSESEFQELGIKALL